LTFKHKNIYLKYIYRLIQGLFHIASARYQSRADDKVKKVFKRYNFWIRIWLTSNLSCETICSLFCDLFCWQEIRSQQMDRYWYKLFITYFIEITPLQLLLPVTQTIFFWVPRFSIRRKKNLQKLNVFFLDQNCRNYRLYGIILILFLSWKRRIAPLMVIYHYVKFYISIIIHLEVININGRNFNFPIGFYSNPHPLWTPQNITLTRYTVLFLFSFFLSLAHVLVHGRSQVLDRISWNLVEL
jgi:hypothetical protein